MKKKECCPKDCITKKDVNNFFIKAFAVITILGLSAFLLYVAYDTGRVVGVSDTREKVRKCLQLGSQVSIYKEFGILNTCLYDLE